MIRLFLVPCYDSYSDIQTEDTRKYNTLETRCVGGMEADNFVRNKIEQLSWPER